jgi:hypothetical protein
MSWVVYLALIICAGFAGKLAVEGRGAFRIGTFEKTVAVFLVVVLVVYTIYSYFESRWYERLIPADLEISDVVLINGESGFREGCGAAIFSLNPETTKRIAFDGLNALKNARQARGHNDAYHSYSIWQKTPYVETGDGMTLADRWLTGLGCAGIKGELGKQIYKALRREGSFFATTDEGGLIIIPSFGLAVFSYHG